MRYKSFIPALMLTFLVGCMSTKFQKETAIKSANEVLDKQVVDWNRGDLLEYMGGYWKSDSLQFIGKNGVTYGWDKTYQNYLKSYPSPDAMGKLTFTITSVKSLGPLYAYVTGKWQLKRDAGDLNGSFTLLFRKFDDGWKIISDHSS